MRKRILSLALACVMLSGLDGIVYAAEIEGTEPSQEEEAPDLEEEELVIPDAPGQVLELEAAVEDNQITLRWNPVEEADGYLIYRKTQEAEQQEIAQLEDGQETEFTDCVDWEESESYTYQVQAYRTYEDAEAQECFVCGEMSEEKTVVRQIELPALREASEIPAAPVLAVANCRYDYVELSWSALSIPETDSGYYIYSVENGTPKIIAEFERNAQGYTIYTYTNGVKNPQASGSVGNLTTLSYQEKNVVHNKTYQFQVAAYVDKSTKEQVGAFSNMVTATPKIQTPVIKSAVSNAYNSATITWQTTTDSPDGYEIYRKEYGAASYQKIAVAKTGSYTDKTLTVGKKYYYRVRSVKTLSNGSTISSSYTSAVSVQPKLSVTTLKVSPFTYTSVRVSWGKVSGASGYVLYRSTSKNGKYTKVAAISSGKTVSYRDKSLSTGKTYYYKVRAYYASGSSKVYSSYSNIGSAKVVPAAPKTTSVTSVSYNTLRVKWGRVNGANGYVLYRSTSENGKYTRVAVIKKGTTLSYDNTKLTTGKKYYYKVRAYRTVGKTKVYGTCSTVKSGTPIPARVTGTKAASVNANKIKLTWNKVSGAKSYTIYRSTSKNGKYTAVKTGCTTSSYTNSGLKNGTTYYYKVAAVRGKTRGKSSSCASAKAVSLTVSKTSLTLQKGGKQKITATASPKATVKWSSSNTKVAKVSSGGTITGVSVGSAKIYAVANGVKKTIQVKIVPAASKISAVSSVSYNTLRIKWSKVSGADGYVLYRSTSKNGKYTRVAVIKKATTLSYDNTKLTTGKTYYYKIRSYQTVGKSKVYSSSSAAVSGKPIPARVTGAKATAVNANKIKLAWNKVSGAKSYTIYRSTSKSGKYTAVKTGCTTTSYTNSGLKNGTTYYYRIAAVRGTTRGNSSSYASAKAASLTVSQSTVTIQQGMSQKVTATAGPSATVKWSSSNTKVAKVSSAGTIRGVSAGSAKVYAKANGLTVTITVKVKKTLNGIDVSKWQGNIDFNAVKSAGIDFVMIRVYNGYTEDPYFETNYAKAKAAGLNIGVYYYTYATTTQQVQKDAMTVLGILNGRSLQYPVTIDMEDATLLNGLSNAGRTDILWTFCSTIQQNSSYKYALYANLNWLNNYFENYRLVGMPIWIARYCDPSLGHRYTGAGNVFMWQYSSQGTVSGINGYVDMNVAY